MKNDIWFNKHAIMRYKFVCITHMIMAHCLFCLVCIQRLMDINGSQLVRFYIFYFGHLFDEILTLSRLSMEHFLWKWIKNDRHCWMAHIYTKHLSLVLLLIILNIVYMQWMVNGLIIWRYACIAHDVYQSDDWFAAFTPSPHMDLIWCAWLQNWCPVYRVLMLM